MSPLQSQSSTPLFSPFPQQMADDSAAEDLQLLTVEDEDKLKANSELLTLIKKLSNYNEADTWIGPYAVQRVLGEGATGIVKLANHRDNKEVHTPSVGAGHGSPSPCECGSQTSRP